MLSKLQVNFIAVGSKTLHDLKALQVADLKIVNRTSNRVLMQNDKWRLSVSRKIMSLEDHGPISLANLERSLSYHGPSFQHSEMEMRPFYRSNLLNNGNSKQKTGNFMGKWTNWFASEELGNANFVF